MGCIFSSLKRFSSLLYGARLAEWLGDNLPVSCKELLVFLLIVGKSRSMRRDAKTAGAIAPAV